MYFWRINALKQMLIESGLSENNVFKYMLWYTGLTAVAIEIILYLPLGLVNKWDYLDSVLAVIIPLLGTMFAYKSNGSDAGKDFLTRYISISFVMVVRYTLYLVPVVIILTIYYALVFEENAQIYTTPVEVVIFSVWYVALYYSIAKHINNVAKACAGKPVL